MQPYDPFNRWKLGPFAYGASGASGGHWFVLGLYCTWLTNPPHEAYELSLFNLVAIRWTTESRMGFWLREDRVEVYAGTLALYGSQEVKLTKF